jgi:hypothetical protein
MFGTIAGRRSCRYALHAMEGRYHSLNVVVRVDSAHLQSDDSRPARRSIGTAGVAIIRCAHTLISTMLVALLPSKVQFFQPAAPVFCCDELVAVSTHSFFVSLPCFQQFNDAIMLL